MIIDRTHRPWIATSAGVFVAGGDRVCVVCDGVAAGPRGGSAAGLTFGIAGYALMLFAGLLGARKKVPTVRIGRAQTWMRGHLWLGLLSFPLILFHAGFAWRGPLTAILMLLLVMVILSGIAGAALQHFLPRIMTAQVPMETIYEEIPHVRAQLLAEADELVESASALEVEHEDKAQFSELYRTSDSPTVGKAAGRIVAVAAEFGVGCVLSGARRSGRNLRGAAPIESAEALVSLASRMAAGARAAVDRAAGAGRRPRRRGAALLRWSGRSRSTKKLAQRIDLNYFKRLYPIPRWRRLLSYACVAIGLVWLGWGAVAGKQQAFNAGPLAHSHSLFTRNCSVCHVAKAAFAKAVTDQACLACHDGAMHQAQQMFTPACTECHVEHRGAFRLEAVRDQSCTQCHSNLQTKSGSTKVARTVASFANDHPEFAALRSPDAGNDQVWARDSFEGGVEGAERDGSAQVRRLPRTCGIGVYDACQL